MEHKISERKKHKSLAIWGFFVLLAALLLSQLAGVVIANIVIGLFSVLLPIFLAITLAYLFKKLVTLVEVKLFHKLFTKHKKALQYRRIVSLSIVFALFLLLIVVFLLLFIPLFLNRITDLVNNSDSYISKVINELTQFFSNITLLQQFQLQDKVSELINNFSANLQDYFPALLENALQLASDTTLIVLNIILSFILAFLMLKDKEEITLFIKRFLHANVKTTKFDYLLTIAKKSDEVLYSYFIGKCLEALIIFLVVVIGFYVFGVPDAILLAFILAMFNFIPYLGAVFGLLPALVLTIIFSSVSTALWATFYALMVVIFVTSFVSPVIFGKKLKVSALVILLSVLIGGGMFGVFGMLFAPPIVAILAVITNESVRQKEEMKLIIKSYGVTEEDLQENEVLIEATKLTLEKKNQTKKP